MMRFRSIQSRLTILVVSLLTIMSLAGLAVLLFRDVNRAEQILLTQAKQLNALLSQDFAHLVRARSLDLAADITARLQSQKAIRGIVLFNEANEPVFRYGKNFLENAGADIATLSTPQFGDDVMTVAFPVVYDGQHFGKVVMQVSTVAMQQVRSRYASLAFIVFSALILSGFFLSYLIHYNFTRPIQTLAQTLRRSAKKADARFRLDVDRDDEIGELMAGFNAMQVRIEQANRRLREKEYALDQHALVLITDAMGNITYCNPLLAQTSGYSNDELCGMHIYELSGSLLQTDWIDSVQQTLLNGEVWHGEVGCRDRKGRVYWVEITVLPLQNGGEDVHAYIAIGTNITEQKKIEQALRQSELRYSTLFEKSADAILLLEVGEHERRFVDCNQATVEMLGYENKAQLLHTHPSKLSPPQQEDGRDSYEKAEEMMQLALDQGSHRFEWIHTRKNGENFPVEVLLTAIPMGEKQFLHVVWRDISERRQTEQALRQSQKMEAIGQLSGGIAHDFNNILGVIIGNLDLLEKKAQLDASVEKRLAAIRHAAQRAAGLTRQLLGFARRREQQRITVNINKHILHMKEMIARSLTPQIDIEYQLDENIGLCHIDAGDFEDALLNLIINARDAMHGRGRLTIETRNLTLDEGYCQLNPGTRPGDYVELIISDTGEGMSQATQERIFEPFFTTKEQGKGTGLGLAMVFGFVQRSQGAIKVYSEEGIGTSFRLFLPQAQAGPEADSTESHGNFVHTGNETILVVDDETDLLELVEENLKALGYTVYTASNAEQALTVMANNGGIDLVFSDVVMPGGMNGFELAETLSERYPGVKILLTSGYTERAVARNGQSRFTATMLDKPYTQLELGQRIRAILDKKN